MISSCHYIYPQEAIRKQKEREERIRREFERRMNPKTKEDFDLLYHTLESEFNVWREILERTRYWCNGVSSRIMKLPM